MRSPSVLAFRPRRVLALAGLVSLTGGLLMLPGLTHPGRAVASAGALTATKNSGATITGPHLWDPAHSKPLASASSVTVSQTNNLVNEMVHVTWPTSRRASTRRTTRTGPCIR